eukprot:6179783-Pleurochrysis_carterae.AAC.2
MEDAHARALTRLRAHNGKPNGVHVQLRQGTLYVATYAACKRAFDGVHKARKHIPECASACSSDRTSVGRKLCEWSALPVGRRG